MAKQVSDRKTVELPGLDKPKGKGGRPPLGTAPMSPAERKRRSRLNSGVRQLEIDSGVRSVISTRAADNQLSPSEFALAGLMAFDYVKENHPEVLASILKHCQIKRSPT